MAELADAGGLNPPEGNFLRVRFPLRALSTAAADFALSLCTHVAEKFMYSDEGSKGSVSMSSVCVGQ